MKRAYSLNKNKDENLSYEFLLALNKNYLRMKRFGLIAVVLVMVITGCSVNYTFTGTSISPEVKTVSIKEFPNRAPNNNPTLSSYFSEELRNKFMRQTKLELVESGGDIQLEGSITQYNVTAEAMQANLQAAQSRLTIQMKVKFINSKEPEQDFDKSFSDYAVFDGSGGLSGVEDQLVEEIVEKLIEKIFNDSVANW